MNLRPLLASVALALIVGCGSSPPPRTEAPAWTGNAGSWTAGDGKVLSFESWRPEAEPKAVWILVHGFGGAGPDLAVLGRTARDEGDAAYAPNLRGMGTEPDPEDRGDVLAADQWIADLDEFAGLLRKRHPGRPLFVAGESLGASLVLAWLDGSGRTAGDPAGVLLLAPVVEFGLDSTWWQRQVFRVFLLVRPERRIDLAAMEEDQGMDERPPLTPIPEEREAAEAAPHRLESMTLRFLATSIRLVNASGEHLPALAGIPRFLAYGGRDTFVDAARVRPFAERFQDLPGPAETVFYPEGHHLLLRDYVTEDLLGRIAGWRASILARIVNRFDGKGFKSF